MLRTLSAGLFLIPLASAYNSLSYGEVAQIISTEATKKEDGITVTYDSEATDSEKDFDVSIEAQWSINRADAEKAPYLVCHSGPGQGSDRIESLRSTIASASFDHFVYNRRDKTCVLESLSFADVRVTYEHITVTPLTPWMKMPENTLDGGLADNKRFIATLCPSSNSVGILSTRRQVSLLREKALAKLSSTFSSDCSSTGSFDEFYYLAINPQGLKLGPRKDAEPLSALCISSLVRSLASNPSVCTVEYDAPVKTLNSGGRWIIQGEVTEGGSEVLPFHRAGIKGFDQVAQMSDTGLSVNSCYFYDETGEVPRDQSETVEMGRRKVVQYYAKSDDSDGHGHGTHCAGTILGQICPYADCSNSSPQEGTAPEAKIAVYDIGSGSGGGLNPDLSNPMFTRGQMASASVHSASWGNGVNSYQSRDMDYDRFQYANPKFSVVFAAGNSGSDPNRSSAVAKNNINVCASQNKSTGSGSNYIADFSSSGPSGDGRIKPDICAPGHVITSAMQTVGRACNNRSMSGTSMACPGVAGAVLLIRQYFMEGFYPHGSRGGDQFEPSSALVKAVILNGGKPLIGRNNGMASSPYDRHQGFGRISLIDSLYLENESPAKLHVEDEVEMSSNDPPQEFIFNIIDGCSTDMFSATMTYTDVEGATSCSECLINRLDMVVERSGTTYYPNGLSVQDTKNNNKRVQLQVQVGDDVTVKISVNNLASSSQKFALAATGCFELGTKSPTDQPTTSAPTVAFPSDSPSKSSMPSKAPSESPTAAPTPFKQDGSLQTSLDANEYWWHARGNMFDIKPKRNLRLVDLDIHKQGTATDTLEMYVREGSWEDARGDESKWTKLGSVAVSGGGLRIRTNIGKPSWLRYDMEAGKTYGVYLRYESNDYGLYSPPSRNNWGDVYAENGAVSTHAGAMVQSRFGSFSTTSREWQGTLYYWHLLNVPTAKPSQAPVKKPTTAPVKKPTQGPVGGPSPSGPPTECKDDPRFRYNYSASRRSKCKFLKRKCEWYDKYGRQVKKYCKETCGTCNRPPTSAPTEMCEDNPDFRYEGKEDQGCGNWVAYDHFRCGFPGVKENCPITCACFGLPV